jgi:hypothetical protein
MKIEANYTSSVKDILHAYSGSSIKRIQYAIRMGILPRPEVFGQLLNKKRITKNNSKCLNHIKS